MDHQHILAAFPKPCGHIHGGNYLLNTATPPARAPLADPGRYVAGRRCTGVRSDGKLCRAYAKPGLDFCRNHADQAGAEEEPAA